MSDGDLFDAVEVLEKQHKQRGLDQGEAEGRRRQYRDGYGKGWQQACHVLQELGTLRGVVAGLLQESEQPDDPKNFSWGLDMVSVQEDKNSRSESLPYAPPLDPKIRSSLDKLLTQLEDSELWVKLGTSSDEKLAQHLSSLQAKARFTLRKLNIPMHVIDRTPEAEF